MSSPDKRHRSHLPMANTGKKGLITFDAKDPASKFRSDRATAPTQGRSQRPDCPHRRCRLRRDQRLRRAVPDTDRGKVGRRRAETHPLPHDGSVLAHPPGVADRPQPPFRWHGRRHRDCDWRAGLLLSAAQLDVAAGEDAQAERLLHRAVRQVSRSAGLGNEPGRAVRRLADGRRRLRVLLRIHRRRGQPVVPDALRRDHARRAGEDARRGLPPDGGHDGQGDWLDRAAEESRA